MGGCVCREVRGMRRMETERVRVERQRGREREEGREVEGCVHREVRGM